MGRIRRPWFRFYAEAIWDPKIRDLTGNQRWLWVSLLALARQSPIPGFLMVRVNRPLSTPRIADASSLSPSVVKQGLKTLMDGGLLDWDSGLSCWFIPTWKERQFESDDVTERTTKHRSKEQPADVSGNGIATPPETETETETETDKTPPAPPARSLSRATQLSKDWEPTDELLRWAAEKHPHISIDSETEKFINHFVAKGETKKNWEAAWRNWIIRAKEFVRPGVGSGSSEERGDGARNPVTTPERRARLDAIETVEYAPPVAEPRSAENVRKLREALAASPSQSESLVADA